MSVTYCLDYCRVSISKSESSYCCCCSVAKLCLTLCDPMDWSMAGFSVLHYLLEFTPTHVCWVDDAIQPSHALSPPSHHTLHLSLHQSLFHWVGFLHQVANVIRASACISPSNEYSGLISFRIDWFGLLAVQGTQESSPAPLFKSIYSLGLSLLYGPTLTFIHDYWKNHSLD